jgi:chaperonin GroES
MNIRPLHDRIVVKRIEEPRVDPVEKMQGGLYHPRFRQRKAAGRRSRGRRQRQAPRRRQSRAARRQVGDRILFGKYSGSDIKLDGEEYMIMREDEVLGILESQPKCGQEGRLELRVHDHARVPKEEKAYNHGKTDCI